MRIGQKVSVQRRGAQGVVEGKISGPAVERPKGNFTPVNISTDKKKPKILMCRESQLTKL